MYSRKLHQTPSVVFFLPCSTSLRSCRSFNSGNYELLDAAGNGTDCIVLYRQRVEEEQQHVVVFIDIIYGASCSSSKEFITLSAVCHHHQHFGGGGAKRVRGYPSGWHPLSISLVMRDYVSPRKTNSWETCLFADIYSFVLRAVAQLISEYIWLAA